MHFDLRINPHRTALASVLVLRAINALFVMALLFPVAGFPAEGGSLIVPPAGLEWSDTVFQAIQKLRGNQGVSELNLTSNGSTASVLDVETSRQLIDKMYGKSCLAPAMEIEGFKGKKVRRQDIRVIGGIVPAGGVPFRIEVQFGFNEGALLKSPETALLDPAETTYVPVSLRSILLTSESPLLTDQWSDVTAALARPYEDTTLFTRARRSNTKLYGYIKELSDLGRAAANRIELEVFDKAGRQYIFRAGADDTIHVAFAVYSNVREFSELQREYARFKEENREAEKAAREREQKQRDREAVERAQRNTEPR